jgi:hypothetical protein
VALAAAVQKIAVAQGLTEIFDQQLAQQREATKTYATKLFEDACLRQRVVGRGPMPRIMFGGRLSSQSASPPSASATWIFPQASRCGPSRPRSRRGKAAVHWPGLLNRLPHD